MSTAGFGRGVGTDARFVGQLLHQRLPGPLALDAQRLDNQSRPRVHRLR